MNLDDLLIKGDFKASDDYVIPPQFPVSIIDLERSPLNVSYDMHFPMQDPCPNCGGFCMRVGDWVCWGRCYGCYEESREGEDL